MATVAELSRWMAGLEKLIGRWSANCSQWRCRNDRLEPDVRRFRCGAHRGGAGLSVDSDHHVGGFDNRIRFGTGLKSQLFRGLFGDDRHHLDAGRQLDHDFRIDRSCR